MRSSSGVVPGSSRFSELLRLSTIASAPSTVRSMWRLSRVCASSSLPAICIVSVNSCRASA